MLQVLVVEGEGPNLFDKDWISAVKVFLEDFGQIDYLVSSSQFQVLLEKHFCVFNDEISTLKGKIMKLHVDPNVKPRYLKLYCYHTLWERKLKQN